MSRRVAVGIGAVVATVVVTVAARASGGTAARPLLAPPAVASVAQPLPPSDAASPPPGPNTVLAGVPMGYAHSPAGAVSAALHFLTAAESVIGMPEPQAEAAQAEMATAAAAGRLVAALRSKLAALRDGFGPGPVGYRIAPLATRLSVADADHVDVDVWYVAVVEPPASPAYDDWRVMGYQLAWERGDWHEAAEADDSGPRPAELAAAQSTPPADWAAELAGYVEVAASDG